jgi:hypothetical protein
MQLVTSTARQDQSLHARQHACRARAPAVPMGAQHTPSLHHTITLIVVVYSAHVAYIHLLHSVVPFTLLFHMSVPLVFKWCSVHPNKVLYSSPMTPILSCELPRSPSFPPRLPCSQREPLGSPRCRSHATSLTRCHRSRSHCARILLTKVVIVCGRERCETHKRHLRLRAQESVVQVSTIEVEKRCIDVTHGRMDREEQ